MTTHPVFERRLHHPFFQQQYTCQKCDGPLSPVDIATCRDEAAPTVLYVTILLWCSPCDEIGVTTYSVRVSRPPIQRVGASG